MTTKQIIKDLQASIADMGKDQPPPVRLYTDDEVQGRVKAIMAALPVGSYVTSKIDNGGRSVILDVALPDGSKREVFEHGVVPYFNYGRIRTRLGPDLDDAAVQTIIDWSKT